MTSKNFQNKVYCTFVKNQSINFCKTKNFFHYVKIKILIQFNFNIS